MLYIAGALGVEPEIVRRELWRAIRRSEPDANEVYGLIKGARNVAARASSTATWAMRLEPKQRPRAGAI